ncbi:MAG: hypothetical protein FWG03_08120 [Clostridiales bacterium]|nr:hypothetical protein [Clostridiales bacterium]
MNNKTLHIPSLVLGIIALTTTWVTFGITGIILGIIGIALSRRAKYEYRTTVGFVLSLVALIISVIILIVCIIALLLFILVPASIAAEFARDVFRFL